VKATISLIGSRFRIKDAVNFAVFLFTQFRRLFGRVGAFYMKELKNISHDSYLNL
jgi:hypothetical protein